MKNSWYISILLITNTTWLEFLTLISNNTKKIGFNNQLLKEKLRRKGPERENQEKPENDYCI